MTKRWLAIALAASALGLTNCSTNPTTGRSQFNMLSKDQEIQMGQQAVPEMQQQFGGAVPNPQVQAYVNEIGQKLAAQTEADNPKLPWTFELLNSPIINAFSLPGGKVFITRGLAEKLTNEAQLAGVLGHEIGHVTARHINDQLSRQTVAETALGVAGAAVGGTAGQIITEGGGLAANVVLLKFSRDQENEADQLGMRYMTKVGYNPVAQQQVMQILQQASGSGGGPEFLQTHPLPQSRIQTIQQRLQNEYKAVVNDPKYVLNPQQYQQRMLQPLSQLPPPPPPPKQQGS